MSTVDWTRICAPVKEKYEALHGISDQLTIDAILNEDGLSWLKPSASSDPSYRIFANEVNRLEMAINLFENLLLFEELRHESNGNESFPIDIPLEYFRFPALNNVRNPNTSQRITESERLCISEVLDEAHETMMLGNDDNVVRELLHRLEFLALFSYFEAYLEAIYGTVVLSGTEEDKKRANAFVMRNPLPATVLAILQGTNEELVNLLPLFNEKMGNFLHFAYLVRNAHTHNLGKATDYVINKGKEFGSIVEGSMLNIDTMKNEDTLVRNFEGIATGAIEFNRYIELGGIAPVFRSYVLAITYIINETIINETG